MNLTTGSRVGPYEITGRVGAGGMGEVLRARDTRIGRDVAIKVLPDEVAADPDRLRRFEQEARAAGTLNHPNLITIYDVGTHDGSPYLVMELLEGETLREKLVDNGKSIRLPIRKAMDYAQQLANGLAAAHAKGIIHRDLKPDNIFLTRDGRLKLLDFGLAKVKEPEPSDDLASVTQARKTTPGTVIGTVGYMAPEQVRGQETDQRTDIFAAGAILYEMVSGRRAFHGGSSADTMSAILNQDPPEIDSSSGQHVSPIIDRVIRRCMEKESAQRFESARDLAFALEAVTSSSTSHEMRPAEEAPRRTKVNAAYALLALLAIAGATGWTAYRMGSTSVSPARLTFTQLTTDAGNESAASIAPDGKTFAFVRGVAPRRQIFLQRVDSRSAIPLSRSPNDDDRAPAFSPDGSQIAFRSSRDGGGIFLMGATGESVRRISSEGFDPSWSPDGSEIVFASEEMLSPTSRNSVSHLTIVNVATGALRVLCRQDAMQPVFSPNGKRVLFWGLKGRGGQRDLYSIAVSGDEKSIVAVMDDVALDWNGIWAPDGKSVIFSSDRGGTMNLWRMPVDQESGRALGEPQPLGVPATWAGHISISRDGRQLVYTARSVTQATRRGTLDPATGRSVIDPQPVLAGTMVLRTHEPSPDGEWIAFTTEGRQEDVFVVRRDGSEMRQLTNDADRDRGVSWWPDGSRVVFYSARGGEYDAWSIRIDGSGLTQLTQGLKVNYPIVSSDGTRLALFDLERGGIATIDGGVATTAEWLPPLPGTTERFVPTAWSPDGTRLAGTEWGARKRLYVYSIADKKYEAVTADTELSVSNANDSAAGTSGNARWIDDQRIVFQSLDGQLLIVDLVKKTQSVVAQTYAASIATNGRTFLDSSRSLDTDVWQVTLDR
jgi:eukaryotic-like serine/threonine-protein kinase